MQVFNQSDLFDIDNFVNLIHNNFTVLIISGPDKFDVEIIHDLGFSYKKMIEYFENFNNDLYSVSNLTCKKQYKTSESNNDISIEHYYINSNVCSFTYYTFE
jgi:hypothetical protein